MGTRCWISVKVKTEDQYKTRRFNPELMPRRLNKRRCWPEGMENRLPETYLKKFITTYCGLDGYPSCVGQELLDHYNSYEKALNLTLGGQYDSLYSTHDAETLEPLPEGEATVKNVLACRPLSDAEPEKALADLWNETAAPWTSSSEKDTTPDRTSMICWAYKWKDGAWWVKDCINNTRWAPLTQEYIDNYND